MTRLLEYLPRKQSGLAQFFFDPHQLVVLCEPIAAGQGSGFNLAAVYTDNKIGNKRILSFPGTVRYYRSVSYLVG